MSANDAKVASLARRFNEPSTSATMELDDDDIFAELEAEIENDSSAAFREHGMDQLKREMEHLQQMKSDGFGQYREVTDEKEVIRLTANKPRCVVHFFHHKFKRCEIMDKHLANLAPKYFNTLFIRVFVENVPWLVERMGIKVLPCVMSFMDGVSKDRIIGFEDLGNSDQFETATLEWKLLDSGVVQKGDSAAPSVTYSVKPAARQRIRSGQQDEDSDFDLDD
ncbi:GTPase inhibitor [Epithele typhae]|uniref:GTPase inhibitor n=1 Tax=Epithele typhae TaxID=378194 RepID=UPI0020071FAE|nr:GTPase inhibitor [Epithele typhae]KAH9943503.1 GTPase inhibitor [Epithele typhae]